MKTNNQDNSKQDNYCLMELSPVFFMRWMICKIGEEHIPFAAFNSKEEAVFYTDLMNTENKCSECGKRCEGFCRLCKDCDTQDIRATYCPGCEEKKPCGCNYEYC